MWSTENVSVVILSAFHLNKNYENSGSGSKGKRFSVCPTGKSGAAQKVIPFFPVGTSRLAFHVPIAIEFYCKMSQYSFYSLQQSYHLVLHCASLLRTILASRALERTHNVSNYSQTKPDSEINARFIWNEYGDLYFALHKFGVKRILFKLKIEKTCVEGKKQLHCSKCPKLSAYQGCFNNLASSYRKMYFELVK